MAAMPSPRPMNPMPSLVVALTLTSSRPIASASPSRSAILAAAGSMRGRSQITVASTLTTRQPASAAIEVTSESSAMLSAPL